MLVLTRRVGESIIIDKDVIVKILGIETFNGVDTIRVGIDAPKEKVILREEIVSRYGK